MKNRINSHLPRLIFQAFVFLVFVHSLAAYSFAGVPLQWVAQAGLLVVFLWIFAQSRVSIYPGGTMFFVLFIWSLVVTVGNSTVVDYSELMAVRATTSYPIYISLRFLSLLVFASSASVVYWLCQRGYKDKVISSIGTIGVLVSLFAVYIYLAQTYGWPEPPRTRVGTSGVEQKISFSYAFHRALGTFREPSHMAQWLLVPLFCVYYSAKSIVSVRGFIIGTAILLSGSLTGIMGAGLGLAAALVLTNGFRFGKIITLLKFSSPFIVAWLVFSFVAVGYQGGAAFDLVDVIWTRIEPIIFDQGVYSTNRSYVYEYVANQEISLFGLGLGNANIKFGYDEGYAAMPSLLNLFLMMILSTGVIGLTLMGIFLVYPLILHFYINKGKNQERYTYLLAGYFGWLLMFVMHAEELTMFYGVIYSLVVYSIFEFYGQTKSSGKNNSPKSSA